MNKHFATIWVAKGGAKTIRRKWVDEQWYLSVVDIIAALTDSENLHDYWDRMKQRERDPAASSCRHFVDN